MLRTRPNPACPLPLETIAGRPDPGWLTHPCIPSPPPSPASPAADELDGNANNLRIILGIDACADLAHIKHVCGHDLTKSLPINILNTTVSFATICT